MDTENIRDVTTDGSKSVIPTDEPSRGEISLKRENPISQNGKDAEITHAAQLAKDTPKPAQRRDDLPTEGTPQDWIEILWQSRRNGIAAGLVIPVQNVVVDGVSMITFAIINAHLCSICGYPNAGTDRCYNPRCERYGD